MSEPSCGRTSTCLQTGTAASRTTRGFVRRSPTLRCLIDAGAQVVVISHLGRPGGGPDPRFSLHPVAERLAQLLDQPVEFCPTTSGAKAEERAAALSPGSVLLLENTRFHPGETRGDPAFAAELGRLADLFVNDAFGAAHRGHASTTGVAHVIRERGGRAVAGLLLERELDVLDTALREPKRPFVAVLGGAKISGKIDVIEALLPRVDRLLVGGAMANTFFSALGLEVGRSLLEEDKTDVARRTLEEAGGTLRLPVDCVVASELIEDAATQDVPRTRISPESRVGDIGPASARAFAEELDLAATVLWNGPMGVYEMDPFRAGTNALAHAVAQATDRGALTVVGGGDSVAAVHAVGVADRVSHISTGGGASLELLAGRELPALAALSDLDSEAG